jgi:hypothetical protein
MNTTYKKMENVTQTLSVGLKTDTNRNQNPNNGESKMTRQERRKMEREGYKLISFSELKEISITNHGKLNRSIDTEELEMDFPEIKSGVFLIQKLMEHHHSYGKPVEVHYRCGVKIPNVLNTLFQDMSIEQWNRIGSSEIISHN